MIEMSKLYMRERSMCQKTWRLEKLKEKLEIN